MRKIIKVILSLFIFINIFNIEIFAEDLSYIEEGLINLGVNEEYSENIVEYLEHIEISEGDFQEIENNINDIKTVIEESNEESLDILKYYTIYDNVINIAEIMNLDLDVDLSNLSLKILDKKNENILYEGDTNSLIEIYSNYKDGNYTINIAEVFQEISVEKSENIISNTEDNTNINDSKLKDEVERNLNAGSEVNISSSSEVENVLDEYIDKFERYNEELLVNNNNDSIDLKSIAIVLGVIALIFIILKVVSSVKRLQ